MGEVKDELIKELVAEVMTEKEPDLTFDTGGIWLTENEFAILSDITGNTEIYRQVDHMAGGEVYDALQILMEKITKCRKGIKAKNKDVTYYNLDGEAIILESAGVRRMLVKVCEIQYTF